MASVLCIDFDDTLVDRDIALAILERFAHSSWRDLHVQRRAGQLTLEQYSAAALDLVEADTGEIVEFALSVATPRAGLLELLDWTLWNDWSPVILSNGWDIYINPILERMGVDRVVRHCGRARFNYRWQLRYLSPRGIELADSFKLSYVAAYREQSDFVAYVGDGPSDIAPARLSQAVFARDALLDALDGTHSCVHPFETFHDITTILDRDADTWLASFSSSTAAGA